MKNLKALGLVLFVCCNVPSPHIHAVDDSISTEEKVAKTWNGYNVNFSGSGSIAASPIAATISGNTTLTFGNAASVNSNLTTKFEMKGSDYLGASAPEYPLLSHIHATSNDASAVGIKLSGGVQLILTPSGFPCVITADYNPAPSATATYGGAVAAIGESVTTDAQNGSSTLLNTAVGLISGTENKVNTLVARGGLAASGGNYYGAATVVVGASLNTRHNAGTNTDAGVIVDNSGGNSWAIGDYNALIAYSGGTKSATGPDKYFGSAATVLGASCASSFNQGDTGHDSITPSNNVCGAEMSNITLEVEDHNLMEAYAGGYCTPLNTNDHYYGSTATVIGASCTLGGGGGTGPAKVTNMSLTIGEDNNFTAYGSAASTVLGASCDSVHKGSAAIVGVSLAEENGVMEWEIGNANHFKSCSGFSAAVFGASCNSGDLSNYDEAVVFGGKWTIGNNNTFEVYSGSSSAVLGSAYNSGNPNGLAGVGVYGAASRANNDNLSISPQGEEWTVGDSNIFISAAGASAAVFGSSAKSGNTGIHARVANAKWVIGRENTLATSAHYIAGADPAYLLFETMPKDNNHPYATASVLGTSCDSTNGRAEMSGVTLTMDRGNSLTASASTGSAGGSVASANVIGAATRGGASVANNMVVNMNGGQTLAAVAYSAGTSTVNVIGADNTDKGAGINDFGWRVGIFATGTEITDESNTIASAITESSRVNILGAKLENDWSIGSGIATATLGNSQGTETRAFALGNDFKIYIGGMADPANVNDGSTYGFASIPANGETNAVNILGAISKAAGSANANGSSLTVDSAWQANTYGPVQDIARIDIKGNGQWNVYEPTSGLPDIHVQSGVLHLARDDDSTEFNKVIGEIAGAMTYVDPITGISYKGSEGKVVINTDSYAWNGSSGGSLTLDTGHKLTLYVDSSQEGTTPSIEGISRPFRQVNGYVSIDAGLVDTLTFNGGKIDLANVIEAPETKTTGYWLIRSGANGSVASVAELLGIGSEVLSDESNFIQKNDSLYQLTNSYAATLFALQGENSTLAAQYPWLTDASAAYLFNDETNSASGLFIGEKSEEQQPEEPPEDSDPASETEEQPEEPPVDSDPASETEEQPEEPPVEPGLGIGDQSGSLKEVYVNMELVSLAVTAHDLLSNAIASRLTNIKDSLADRPASTKDPLADHSTSAENPLTGHPTSAEDSLANRLTGVKDPLTDLFVYAVYDHAHQDELTKWGYDSNMGGFVLGIDNAWDLSTEKYLRLGIAFGYVGGKTEFFGSTSLLEESARHNFYMIELFGAHESYNDEQLRTNVALTLGYSRGNDKLHRVNSELGTFDAKVRSNNIFIGLDFVKNLYVSKGFQYGPWLRVNYSRIAQKNHDDSTTAAVGAQHVSAVNHNYLTTILGLNIEREPLDSEHVDKRWLFSLKLGWEYQVMRKHTDATILIDNPFGIGKIIPAYGQPGKHAAVGVLAASKKLNDNWNIVGAYMGRFNRRISAHSLACGIQYLF
ncbi:MAG: autotransporter outer membrane beta-barrel domain-containing protein [Puniceicoccales bacterium]|jgi:hypothetical protein|nr:autotransporter outer membrane beta-barrel domain-containing protein [Puniceicoccales bacterium]